MAEASENKVLNIVNAVCFVVPSAMTLFDMFYGPGMESLSFYIFLRYGIRPSYNARFGHGLSCFILVLGTTIIFTQARIESFRNDGSGWMSMALPVHHQVQQGGQDASISYSIGIIRWIVFMAFQMFCLWMFTTFAPHIFHIRDMAMIGFVIIKIICPYIFIFNHKGMRGMLFTKLSNISNYFCTIFRC